MNITEIKEDIYSKIQSGCIDKTVITSLTANSSVINKECELWDFKLTIEDSKDSYIKLVKHVISFYNSYGGYIIYGIDETEKDIKFDTVGIIGNDLDIQKLKGYFDDILGFRIDVTYCKLAINSTINLGLLHIPKRPIGTKPASCLKTINKSNGEKGLLIDKGATYFRIGDECKQVKNTEEFEFIVGRRQLKESSAINIIEHNLPQRTSICKSFIGRVGIIESLWNWLDDDLNYSIVLAGEGGKGKTSIAYEFSSLVIKSNSTEFEQIVWLTAKRNQFRARLNEYEEIGETHYSNLDSLLKEICLRTGSIESEIIDLNTQDLKRQAKRNLSIVRTLLIIDDVDSNQINEQRRIVETARVICNSNSKAIITTRVNNIYSTDSCIEVPGLKDEEYIELVNNLCNSMKAPKFNEKNILKIWRASLGSPLYTESIIRLCRTDSLENALALWEGKSGEAVREAALKKEISELSLEAKRVLITISIAGSCSITELSKLTGLEIVTIRESIEALTNIFLVDSKRFSENEPRFDVNSTTSLLVIAIADQLLVDYVNFRAEIDAAVAALNDSLDNNRNIPEVGSVIRQCSALLLNNDYIAARETVQNILDQNQYKNNPDLLFTLARINYEDSSIDRQVVRRLFENAELNGQNKEIFYHTRYNLEYFNGDRSVAFDISKKCVQNFGDSSIIWVQRFLEDSLFKASNSVQSKSLKLLISAYECSAKHVKSASGSSLVKIKDLSKEIIDKIIYISKYNNDYITITSSTILAINSGDVRTSIYSTFIDGFNNLNGEYKKNQKPNNQGLSEREIKIQELISIGKQFIIDSIDQLNAEPKRREFIIEQLEQLHSLL